MKGGIMMTISIAFGGINIGWIIGLIFLLIIVWYFTKMGKTSNQDRKNGPSTRDVIEKEFEEGEISRKQHHDIVEKLNDPPTLKDPTALEHTPDYDPAKPLPEGENLVDPREV